MRIEAAVRPLAELEQSLAELYGSWAEAHIFRAFKL
jgi:hypothetical protein